VASTALAASQEAVLRGGRNLTWAKQPLTSLTYTEVPGSSSDGVSLATSNAGFGRAGLAAVRVGLRQQPHIRRVFLSVTYDVGETYSVGLDGETPVTSAGAGSADAALVALKTAIDADGTLTLLCDCILYDTSGAVTVGTAAGGNAAVRLEVAGADGNSYSSIQLDSSGASGILAGVAEPESCNVSVWVYDPNLDTGTSGDGDGNYAGGWSKLYDAVSSTHYDSIALDSGGATFYGLHTGTASQIYAQVDTLAGHGSDSAGNNSTLTYNIEGRKSATGPIFRPGGGIYLGYASVPSSYT